MIDLCGMIDWMTLRLDAIFLPMNIQQILKQNTSRLLKIDKDGNLEWESACRESISSDSHQIVVKFGTHLEIQGSPARVLQGHNVFGSFDIFQCFQSMVEFVQRYFSIRFPVVIDQWNCTRIDFTRNYDMGSLDVVLQAIDSMKSVKVGRQKMRSYDSGVMWGAGSNLHSGKVYAKGPDLQRNVLKRRAFCTDEQLKKSQQLLRLEYSMRRHFLARLKDAGCPWYSLTPEQLVFFHDSYFSKFISEIEVIDMDNLLQKLLDSVGDAPDKIPTKNQARAAYDCYMRCKTMGKKIAQSTYQSRATWYRHLKNLSLAGVGEVDLQIDNVVPLKRRQITLSNPVSCWDDIKLVG